MTRPILWATGVLFAIAISGTTAGQRLAGLGRGTRAEPAQTSASADTARTGPRSLTVDADLRGHFHLHSSIDGRHATMMVDTGASIVALTSEDAFAAGYRPAPGEYTRQISTANGTVQVAPILIREIRVGDITVRNVEAVIVPPGRLITSLLGMSFLRRLSGFDISHGQLTLRS